MLVIRRLDINNAEKPIETPRSKKKPCVCFWECFEHAHWPSLHPRSHSDRSPVKIDDRTSDERGRSCREKDGSSSHIDFVADSPNGMHAFCELVFPVSVSQHVIECHLRWKDGGSYRVDANMTFAQVRRESLGYFVTSGLTCSIRGCVVHDRCVRWISGNAADVDHVRGIEISFGSRGEKRHARAREMKDGRHVERKRSIPCLLGKRFESVSPCNTCIVDEHIQSRLLFLELPCNLSTASVRTEKVANELESP